MSCDFILKHKDNQGPWPISPLKERRQLGVYPNILLKVEGNNA